jgi:hypothetical protein
MEHPNFATFTKSACLSGRKGKRHARRRPRRAILICNRNEVNSRSERVLAVLVVKRRKPKIIEPKENDVVNAEEVESCKRRRDMGCG